MEDSEPSEAEETGNEVCWRMGPNITLNPSFSITISMCNMPKSKISDLTPDLPGHQKLYVYTILIPHERNKCL
jgi:hypothetical protein